MIIEKKEFAKSLRMTATVKQYVESFEGNGFNEKFENLVLFCLANEKQIQERIERSQRICLTSRPRLGKSVSF